jgi:anti-sigma factor RsiW
MTSGWSAPRPRRLLGGHLGSSVSALVDGQLDEETGERAWQHVEQCEGCRRLVEHEAWVKRQLAQIGQTPRAEEPSDRFLGSLRDLDPEAVAWAETQQIEDRGRTRRRAGIALVGAGSVSAAVLGLTTWGGTSFGPGQGDRSPATSIGGAGSTALPSSAVVAPVVDVRGRLPGRVTTTGASGSPHARHLGAHH